MTADISRHALRPLQKFTGVVRQQGRLPLDAEETEAGDIAALMLREALAETICEKGAPGDGYRVTGATVTADDELDFTLDDGSFYLAGLRTSTAVIPGSGDLHMTYRRQPDWLTFPLDTPGPPLPAGGVQRTDLVYLQAWEQTVTATEDSELFERALGGADTSARRRVMSRVQVLDDVPANCDAALDDLVAREYPGGQLDAARCEVLSPATLTIGFTQLDPLEDLCRPSALAGFLGARNETFRVQVTTPGRFVWGRDNAAPLYRVQVEEHPEDGTRRRIVFLTRPRDEFGWPLAGMTVEVLRWGALLDNREKVAEPTGLLLSVENGFDPSDGSILVSAEVPAAWDAWFATPQGQEAINPRDDAEAGLETYFFLRVWTGGGEGSAVDHDMDVGNPVELGETGLTATFSADGLPGDYWIVSARPNTPTEVTPWDLLDGAAPNGPRRLLAPLALLPWDGPTPGQAIDCRHRFRPLCRVGGCCRVTVGDGHISHGDVTSIQEAVARLPLDGGEICIHPGDYTEHVTITGRSNITITGCGRDTRWFGEAARADPLLRLTDCSGIVVRRIAMTATAAEAVLSEKTAEGAHGDLLLEDLRVTISDAGAVAAFEIDSATLRRCRVALTAMSAALSQDDILGRAAAFFLSGNDLTVEHCRIEAPDPPDRLHLPVGGIHIGGGTERVIIRDNVIAGGNGHGITLGSVQYVSDDDGAVINGPNDFTGNAPKNAHLYQSHVNDGIGSYGLNVYIDEAGCIRIPGTPGGGEIPEDTPLFPESAGVVKEVQILRNAITGMGFSGISAHVFAGLGPGGFDDMVAVETIEISDNRITGCMINEVGATTPLLRQFIGWGGIALSLCSDATLRDNLIAGNGAGSTEPIVGVFFAIAEDVRVERNRIERNGIEPERDTALAPGRRGGIIVGIALGGVSTFGEESDALREVDRPALLVAGNTVDAPGARALKAIALGPVMVLGNRLTGAGRSAFASNVFGSLVAGGFALSRLGGRIFQPSAEIDLFDYVLLEILSDVLGGDAVNLVSLCVMEDLVSRNALDGKFSPQRLRGGEMMVNDNQISLQAHSPALPFTLSSVMLLGADDISFCDNQSEIENEVVLALTDLLAISASLRASSNRLQKRVNAGLISAVTFAFMNQTSANQSTHCIFAIGPSTARVVAGNRDVLGLFGFAFCDTLDEIAAALSAALSKRFGLKGG